MKESVKEGERGAAEGGGVGERGSMEFPSWRISDQALTAPIVSPRRLVGLHGSRGVFIRVALVGIVVVADGDLWRRVQRSGRGESVGKGENLAGI